MSDCQPRRGGVIPFDLAPPTTNNNSQGPPHRNYLLASPVIAPAPTRPDGQSHFDNNPMVRSAVRASTAVSEAVANANKAHTQARQLQRENANALQQLADAERVTAMLIGKTRTQGRAERASDVIEVEMSDAMPISPAPAQQPPLITNRRFGELANEKITFENGRRQTLVYAQADHVNHARVNRERQLRAQIEELETRLFEINKALDTCQIEKDEALCLLQREREDWRCIREAVDATDGPKRELQNRILTNLTVHTKLCQQAEQICSISRSQPQVRQMPAEQRFVPRHVFDVPGQSNLARQAVPAQGHSAQPLSHPQSSPIQQRSICEQEMIDAAPPKHGNPDVQTPQLGQPGTEEVRRRQLQKFHLIVGDDVAMDGYDWVEMAHRDRCFRDCFEDISVQTDASDNGNIMAEHPNISMCNGKTIKSDINMRTVSISGESVVQADVEVHKTPTREIQLVAKIPLEMEMEWTVVNLIPRKRPYVIFMDCMLRGSSDGPDLKKESENEQRMKRLKLEMVNEGTESADLAKNAKPLTETTVEAPVVSAPDPTEHAPTDKVPTEAAMSVPAVSEPALAVEETTESEVSGEVSSEPVGIEVALRIPTTVEFPDADLTWSQHIAKVSGVRALYRPTQIEAALTAPAPAEKDEDQASDRFCTAVVYSGADSSELEWADAVETEEVRRMPGGYPTTSKELVLPWQMVSPSSDVSEPAVSQPTPEVEVEVEEGSSSNEVEAVDYEVIAAGDEPECLDPWASHAQQHRQVGGLSHLERILAHVPGEKADSYVPTYERVSFEDSRLASNFSGPNSRAGELPGIKAEFLAHAALQIAEEQRASLRGSMGSTSDSSMSKGHPTPRPAVNASMEYGVGGMGSASWRSMNPGTSFFVFAILALVVAFYVLVLCGSNNNTCGEIMAAPERLLEELRNDHGFNILILNRVIYVLLRLFARDRVVPG
ncbi:uncharacterized protein N7529_003210 [Penicillium soppii]|uniref:uncharacterized protein n=1 Tax=Penicillium soppii TaxID=69789 RepID=UPI00254887E5|nr:uncharacterized protein N7529_003210 [Penicillium soppii]KAJ5874780.1 hypothetical protein N7529_003210 [Penicillium soppii]